MQNTKLVKNCYIWGYIFCMIFIQNKTTTQKIWLWFPTHDIAYLAKLFIIVLDIIVMINILQEQIKTMHDKVLKVIALFWFHNDAYGKNCSWNGHSNKPSIVG